MIKVAFHLHTCSDPEDAITHNEEALFKEASRLNFNILALTLHNKFLFTENLQNLAEKYNLLLIPGIEKTIEKKHVLIINATKEAEQIETFAQLKSYKASNPNCFIIAPHPFYPTSYSLNLKLLEHHNLFDAIEYSWYHTKKLNRFNRLAKQFATTFKKTLVATPDNHILSYLNTNYFTIPNLTTSIKQKKYPEIATEIFNSIKNNHHQNHSTPQSPQTLILTYAIMKWMQLKSIPKRLITATKIHKS